ncbi:MAG: helix-turn-helix domain-containing protein [Candidatus Pristimantibacillus lignocellulolyticus]|uniref:Helix-turn-helix domain-containing protein n=1 Tax=Candidatus Pristimantibacillus lignocellulolyticus TaxID=2994561 RepID=A0A9J6ZEN8_9BACL|nr:MAG: helix-turn-helix domain-containing protein [Candidatus Pristimantibacillus lignocellulolyticus]
MSNNFNLDQFYSVVGDNIKKYRLVRNFSLQDLAERVGVTKKTIHRYENAENKIKDDTLKIIADSLNVTITQLTEGAYEAVGMVQHDESENVSLPIVGRISCGTGGLAFDDVEGYEQTPRSWINGGQYFYLRAKGDSMTGARIFEGDLLLIRSQEEVEDGEIAAVLIDDEAVLKKVYKQNGMLVLQSTNPNYSPIIFNGQNENIRIIGKLIKIVINL